MSKSKSESDAASRNGYTIEAREILTRALDNIYNDTIEGNRPWPKSKFRWENGIKVYKSYEDYYND